MNQPLPPELERRWGHLSYIHQRGANEWSAECPKCGDIGHAGREYPDRFRMFGGEHARGWCRKCAYQEFADSDKKNFVITPEMRAQWLAEREQREQDELRKAQHAIELLRKEHLWQEWHRTMTQTGYEFWHSKGVTDWAINYYELGYCPSKTIWYRGAEYTTPTATIPVFAPQRQVINVRHRLINPPDPTDKYRPDRAGIPASLYLTNPNEEPHGTCILVEGEIKAIVVATRLENNKLCIVGLPGKNPRQDMLDQLSKCDRIYVVLDPDAQAQSIEITKRLGKRARSVSLPVKADDAFTMYGATKKDFITALKHGRIMAHS